MMKIRILTFIHIIGVSVSVPLIIPKPRPEGFCELITNKPASFKCSSNNGKSLENVPSNVPKHVERLDLSDNSLSTLVDNSFDGLTKIKELILSRNRLSEITDGALAPLSNLKVLMLDWNTLKAPPSGLPDSLEELNLNKNNLINVNGLELLVRLRRLNMTADTSSNVLSFAALGRLPLLELLDVTERLFKGDMDAVALAGMCSLKNLVVTDCRDLFRTRSQCVAATRWAADHGITVEGAPDCSSVPADDASAVPDDTAASSARRVYDQCLQDAEKLKKSFWNWKYLLWVLLIAAVLMCLCVYSGRRKRVKKSKAAAAAAAAAAGAASSPAADSKAAVAST